MARIRTPVWHGPDPDRVDTAYVRVEDDRLTARGSSVGADVALTYALETGPSWVTTALRVQLVEGGTERTLMLLRAGDGGWSAARTEGGEPAPTALPDLSGALDCDLGLCPLTNTMPVLRHGLLTAARLGRTDSHEFVMAWVSVPGLEVHAAVQRYTAAGPLPGGGAGVRFESEGFETLIEFDADGLVRDYPDIAHRS